MASTSVTSPDTLVTIKVNIEGQNRRLKMPLRDLGASTLPDKLRNELHIPVSTTAIFERYSDSAAAFVTLDPNNSSVYKQLYRAAKAKLKLRIKATIIPKETGLGLGRQATVEDEIPGVEADSTPKVVLPPPSSAQRTSTQKNVQSGGLRKIVSLPVAHPPVPAPKVSQPSVTQLQRGFEDLMVSRSTRQSVLKELDEIMNDVCTYKDGSSESVDYFAGLPEIPFKQPHKKTTDTIHGNLMQHFGDLSAMEMPLKQCPYAQANSSFTVFCNNCSRPIVNVHYHCGVCDDGDFDLCLDCTGKGISCSDDNHWMIKRTIENGKVSSSTTETLPPKTTYNNSKTTLIETEEEEQITDDATRTCNSCIQEFPEENFVTCTSCEDYDLCVPCHTGLQHGHDPKHGFAPAVEAAVLDPLAHALLQPGRNAGHHAICDNCNKYIYGVRHKCLECPDWDYCASCVPKSYLIHPGHRFVPIYEPLGDVHSQLRAHANRVKHQGIYCDGPLCKAEAHGCAPNYIVGDRYKCAVCDDLDFCAACEASPANHHNKTHPLIKFKTMIKNVSVTTMGDHVDGQRMKVMGDRLARNASRHASKATETTQSRSANAATQVQTVADLQPTESIKTEEVKAEIKEEAKPEIKYAQRPSLVKVESEVKEIKPEPVTVAAPAAYEELRAIFVRDTVADGTTLPPSHVFEQTWFMRNSGNQVWPAGCSVKFVGGDNMCAVDPEHPASVRELVSSTESTICHAEVAPGQEASFTVLMRTPSRPGKVISYWRLTGPNGLKFGHKLWCDVDVSKPVETPETEVKEDDQSKMVFPKLDKESPASSMHQSAPSEPSNVAPESEADEFEDFLEEDEPELDDETEDGFLTDEEYDILDASDEEYLVEQSKVSKK